MSMMTQDDDKSYENFLHMMNSGSATAGGESAARPRSVTINTFDVAFPAAAPGAGEGAVRDPRGGRGDPEDPRRAAAGGGRFAWEGADGARPRARRRSGKLNVRSSERFRNASAVGELETYPSDSYSFLSIHSPFTEPLFFAFGLGVFLLQVAFLVCILLSLVWQKFMNGEVDNPDETLLARFLPSNVNKLARVTQLLAILIYCIFPTIP